MDPIMFRLGSIEIRWYSVLIALGVLVAYLLANREAKRCDLPKDFIFDLCFYVVLFGILGARLYYVLFNFADYKDDLLRIFAIWNGGLAIHGGIIAGFLTIVVYCKLKKIPVFKITDIAAPSLIIAQAIGRWGNFFNSEAHGPVTTLSNLKDIGFIPDYVIQGMKINGEYYHPTFFYESLWCVIGFLIIIIVRRLFAKNLKTGQLTCLYLIWYSIGRYLIESLRTDSLMLGNFKAAQLVSITLILVGVIGMFITLLVNNKNKKEI